MRNPIFTFLLGCLVTFLLIKGCNSCQGETSNETNNFEISTDSLEIIRKSQAPYIAEISQKEVVIASLQKTVTELEGMKAKGDKLAGNLAERLRKAESDLLKERGELTRLTLLLSETKASRTVAIEEKERDGVGVEIGADELPPLYVAEAYEPNGWYSIKALFDIYADTARFDLLVKNDFEITEFKDENGVSKFRVTNKNPYTFSLPGTNVFDLKPVTAPIQKQRRFGVSLFAGYCSIWNDSQVKFGPGAGIGINYRLL